MGQGCHGTFENGGPKGKDVKARRCDSASCVNTCMFIFWTGVSLRFATERPLKRMIVKR